MSKEGEEAIIQSIGGDIYYYDEVFSNISGHVTELGGDWTKEKETDFINSFESLLKKGHLNEKKFDEESSPLYILSKKGSSRYGRLGRSRGWL